MSYAQQAYSPSSIKTFLVVYSGIRGKESRRWHRFLRTIGVRQLAGLYLLNHMSPRLLSQLYTEAKIAIEQGGSVKLYPLCSRCEGGGWQLGGSLVDQNASYYIV